jgi:hypothetical protein
MVHKARLYAKLLMAVYSFIKGKWGNELNVVGISACGVSKNDVCWGWDPNWDDSFIEMVHKYVRQYGGNPAQCYDILSNHPYTQIAPPDAEGYPGDRTGYHYSTANSFALYRKTMMDYGNGDKPVWFTEVGWPRDYGVYTGDRDEMPERMQAAYVVRLYLTALRLGVETVHVMFIFDQAGNFGFFNYNTRQWYESAYATQNLIKIMPKPRIIGVISDGVKGYYAYRYKPNYNASNYLPVIVAWNVIGPKDVEFSCEVGTYQIIDMLGNTKTVEVPSSLIKVEIGPYPIYIVKLF